jgi:isocitrate dehydrogenase
MPELQARFKPLAESLAANEAEIVAELNRVQGQAMDIGGYFRPDATRAAEAMRPSATFNALLAAL